MFVVYTTRAGEPS